MIYFSRSWRQLLKNPIKRKSIFEPKYAKKYINESKIREIQLYLLHLFTKKNHQIVQSDPSKRKGILLPPLLCFHVFYRMSYYNLIQKKF